MIKKYLRKIVKETIHAYVETTCEIHQTLERNYQHMLEITDRLQAQADKLSLQKLQHMMNELKGIVAMARAALDEGRKFTEVREIGNILNQVSHDVHIFSEDIRRFDHQLQDNREITIALEAYTKEIMKNKRGTKRKPCQ